MSKQVPSIATTLNPFRKAPTVSLVAIVVPTDEITGSLHSCPNLFRALVIAALQGVFQYLPVFNQTSLSPSIRFFSTSRIEFFDHKLIATIEHNTSCDGSRRCRFAFAFALRIAASISVDGIAISIALNIALILSLGDSNNIFLRHYN
ncbi:hypothetical protein QUB05_33205 [Microcoleus sp. F10-C6]